MLEFPVEKTLPARSSALTGGINRLFNEAYTRLLTSAEAYAQACGSAELGGLHLWMKSYGERLRSMADALRRGTDARARKSLLSSAAVLTETGTCGSPASLLQESERVQQDLVDVYEQLASRLDMEAEVYGMVIDQFEELGEVLMDIVDLRREYAAYCV